MEKSTFKKIILVGAVLFLTAVPMAKPKQIEQEGNSHVIETSSSGKINWENLEMTASSRKTLRELVASLRVDDTRTLGYLMAQDPILKAKIEDGITTQKISFYGKSCPATTVLEHCLNPEFREDSSQINPKTTSYSGIIIDCKDKEIAPCLLPEIVSESGWEILSVGRINPVDAFIQGAAGYASSIQVAKNMNRAGTNPLIIQAKRGEGIFKTKIILKDDDALKVLQLERETRCIRSGKILFVI